jgi:hypothetical protein
MLSASISRKAEIDPFQSFAPRESGRSTNQDEPPGKKRRSDAVKRSAPVTRLARI